MIIATLAAIVTLLTILFAVAFVMILVVGLAGGLIVIAFWFLKAFFPAIVVLAIILAYSKKNKRILKSDYW